MSRLLEESEVAEFRALLQNYQLHESGLEQFRSSNFAIIAGPAGAGKDTLRNSLIGAYPDFYLPILSTTTRPPRVGEQDAVTYHFKEVEQVKQSLLNREFFQAELVHNQQISCLDIAEIRKLGEAQYGLSILITETERKLSVIKSDIKTIFLIPPDFATLQSRVRAERMLNQAEIDRRMQAARQEIMYALGASHYQCIISDTVEHVIKSVHGFLQSGVRNENDDATAREVMCGILSEIEQL